MKVSLKTLVFVVALSSLLVVGAYLGWSKAKASTTNATSALVQYHFTNNGTVFGTDPSPIQIVQVSHGGESIPVGKAIAADASLLDGVDVKLRNASPQDIKSARLRIDVIDPQTNKIALTSIGLTLNTRLAPGQEQVGKAIAFASESLRQSVSDSGLAFQKVLIQVDIVEMTNGISWKYGLLHRQDPKDSTIWRPIALLQQQSSLNKLPQPKRGGVSIERVSMRSAVSQDECLYFYGYSGSPNGCPHCTVHDEIWDSHPNPFGTAGPVIYHCPNGQICIKKGYTGWCGN